MNYKPFVVIALVAAAVVPVSLFLFGSTEPPATVAPAIQPPSPAPAAPAGPAATLANTPEVMTDAELEQHPWLKPSPGVVYVKPRRVPAAVHAEYEAFDEAFEAERAGAGHFEQDGYRIDEGSLDHLGLEAGDKIISINGQPVGKANLVEALFPGGSKLAVLVERADGTREVLHFAGD